MVDCFRESARAANQAVEAAYQAFLRRLGNGPRHDLLVRSQASRLAYRDAYCALVSSAVEGGSAQPLIRNACWLDVTNIRLRELEHQLTCQEGDLSCVVPHHPP